MIVRPLIERLRNFGLALFLSFLRPAREVINFPHSPLPQFIKRTSSPLWVFQRPITAVFSAAMEDVVVPNNSAEHRAKFSRVDFDNRLCACSFSGKFN